MINGTPQGTVSPDDRGLNYGDGLFETCAVRDGRPLLWERHRERLHRGCRQLRIPPPAAATLDDEVTALCRDQQQAVVKVLLTRGSGGRGYRPPAKAEPLRIVSIHPWPQQVEERARRGISVRRCITPSSANPALARIKHTSRLENVLARAEWSADDPAEGLMLNLEGEVVEGTASNVFMVKDDMLYTPSLERSGVAGIVREVLLEGAAEAGIPVAVTAIPVAQLKQASEVFVCNSVAGIWPVVWFDGTAMPQGPLTRRLQGILAAKDALAYPLEA
ncbi:MAG: aminodeoxychorismate lyase [Gammaproteobacteria bacterium]|nr:aminodeoxychorismate lyase [Gammaproteobacteria bacterium]